VRTVLLVLSILYDDDQGFSNIDYQAGWCRGKALLVLGTCWFQFWGGGGPAILSEVFRGFPLSLQENVGKGP
jgi:hypothetical protein